MTDKPWTDDDWRKWRAENVRLMNEGWELGTRYMMDGTIQEYAIKDGVEIRRDPKWERDEDGNYISPVT